MLSLDKEICSVSLSARIFSYGKDFDCGQGSVLSARIFCLGKDFEFWQGF